MLQTLPKLKSSRACITPRTRLYTSAGAVLPLLGLLEQSFEHDEVIDREDGKKKKVPACVIARACRACHLLNRSVACAPSSPQMSCGPDLGKARRH